MQIQPPSGKHVYFNNTHPDLPEVIVKPPLTETTVLKFKIMQMRCLFRHVYHPVEELSKS